MKYSEFFISNKEGKSNCVIRSFCKLYNQEYETVFNELVRGYVDDTGIYFYSGDFETNEYVEKTAKSWYSSIDTNKPVYCGVNKGIVGERWIPIKRIV